MAETFNIYCDESCHLAGDSSSVMVLGCIWCLRDRVPEISKRLREFKSEHGLATTYDYRDNCAFELKWQKVSQSKIAYYKQVIDYFFDDDDLHFRAIIIPNKLALDHGKFPGQDHDTWYYKMLYHVIDFIVEPSRQYRVYLDIKDTRSELKRKGLEQVLRTSNLDFHGVRIERVQQMRSHESELMQLADLLIGAISYFNRGLSGSDAKNSLIQRIKERSGKSLSHSTLMRETKFNLFRWTGQSSGND